MQVFFQARVAGGRSGGEERGGGFRSGEGRVVVGDGLVVTDRVLEIVGHAVEVGVGGGGAGLERGEGGAGGEVELERVGDDATLHGDGAVHAELGEFIAQRA